jgi:hypothetical protein
MANVSAPFGFRQFRRLDGGAPTAGFDTLLIASSDANVIGTGDVVATSTGSLTGQYVSVLSSGLSQIRGVFMGCEFFSPTVNRKVWSPFFPGSVATTSGTNDAQAWVCTDPEMMYTVQTSTGTVVGSSQISLNFGVSSGTFGAASTLTGISGMTLASTSAATTATLPWRLMDMYSNWAPPGVNGTDNTSAGNIVIVAPNNFDRKNTTGI